MYRTKYLTHKKTEQIANGVHISWGVIHGGIHENVLKIIVMSQSLLLFRDTNLLCDTQYTMYLKDNAHGLYLRPLQNVGWNYLAVPNWCNCSSLGMG